MGASSQTPDTPGARKEFRARPKPYSLERRFRLMQTGTIALTIVLISSVVYWNFSFQGRLASSLVSLHATLDLNTRVHTEHESAARSFWEAYYSETAEAEPAYAKHSRALGELLRGYDGIAFPPDEGREVDAVRYREKQFQKLTARLLAGARHVREDEAQLIEVGRLGAEIESHLNALAELHIRHLESLDARMEQASGWMTALLLLIACFVLLTVVWFRRVHRRHLWGPLEQLRRMVGEVRRGNRSVTGEVPESVELGSLVRAFLEMAGQLREWQEQLEEKVIERTARLEEAQKELLQAAKLASLGQLVSGVAHEINNPLTSILGFSEVALSRPGVDDSLRRQLVTIREEAMRLRNLVANLTSFARRAPHRTHVLDLRGLLDRLVDLRNYQLQANNIWLHIDQPPEPVWASADPEQILQVLLNLVSNAEQAIQGRRERGEIRMACGVEGPHAWLSVRDNGTGMTDEVQERIFEPFFTTRPPGEGAGLGLSISHGIIEQHHGRIAVESRPGKGTAIRIAFPAAAKPIEASAARALPARAKAAPPEIFHALVVDDEKGILEMVEQALERLDCRATLVQGSAGVERALQKREFDLVICDLKMPGRSGLEIYRLLRAKWPQLAERFLLMTGNLADADQHAEELAAVPILPKPFTLARLRQAVEPLLPGRAPAR